MALLLFTRPPAADAGLPLVLCPLSGVELVDEDSVVEPGCQVGTNLTTSGTVSVQSGAQVGNTFTIDIRDKGLWSTESGVLANDAGGRIEIQGGRLRNRNNSTLVNVGDIEIDAYNSNRGELENMGNFLNQGDTLVLNGSDLELSGGALANEGSLRVRGDAHNRGGSYAINYGQLQIQFAGTWINHNGSTFVNYEVDISGGVPLPGELPPLGNTPGVITLAHASSDFKNRANADLFNPGTIDVSNSAEFLNDGTITNVDGGILRINGAGILDLNSGTLQNEEGALVTNFGATHNRAGHVILNGGDVRNSGTWIDYNGSEFTNGGLIENRSGGSWHVRTNSDLTNLRVPAEGILGILVNEGDFLHDGWLYNSGEVTNRDLLDLNSGFVLNLPAGLIVNEADARNRADNSVTNSGTIRNEDSWINYNGCDFVNDPLGRIEIQPGSFWQNRTNSNVANQGTIQNDGSWVNDTALFTNTGTVHIASFASVSGTGIYTQTSGVTQVEGTLTQPAVAILGGLLEGNGTLTTNLTLGGILSPGLSAGQLDVVGDLTATASAELLTEILGLAPASEYDVLAVTGSVALDGQLRFTVGPHAIALSDTFTVLSAGSLSGSFSNVANGERLFDSSGNSFVVSYGIGSAFASSDVVLSDFVRWAAADVLGVEGLAQGGSVTVVVLGTPVVVTTDPGETPDEIAAKIAAGINADPALAAQGIFATPNGDLVRINEAFDSSDTTDPGITLTEPPIVVPALSAPATLVLVGMLIGAGLFLGLRRGARTLEP